MPISNKITYGYKDLGILTAEISYVKSRSECHPYYPSDGNCTPYLPIFASPMTSVVSSKNFFTFHVNGIDTVIPRDKYNPLDDRMALMKQGQWVAVSLDELNSLFCDKKKTWLEPYKTYKICVDVANGTMANLYDTCKRAKRVSLKQNYNLTIMTGNINNPATYGWVRRLNNGFREKYKVDQLVIDYLRVGIGGGDGCFVDGTMITCSDNIKKEIQDVEVGDMVLTHDGTYQMVTSRLRYKTDEDKIRINGDITCTKDHKFYVINKSDAEKVTEDNLNSFAYWVEAHNLNKDKHLLVALEADKDA